MIPQKKAIKGLYAVTPDTADTALLESKTVAAIKGGARVVQYRDKSGDARLRRAQASALADVCRRGGARFIINDDVELAANIDADGVHVGIDDWALADARARLGPDRIIGKPTRKPTA